MSCTVVQFRICAYVTAICRLLCDIYLHREPLSINGVLRPWSPITPPVEVKLGGSVVTRQTPACQSDQLWQSKVGYREGRERVS